MEKNLWTLPVLLTVILTCLCCNPSNHQEDRPMLAAIPSDAVCAVVGMTCSSILEEYIDSTDILRKVVYGPLSDNEAVLSFCYTTTLIPILAVDVTRDADSLRFSILEKMGRVGLHAEISNGILVSTSSESLLYEIKRHLASGTSIMEAPMFPEALSAIGTEREVIFIRNSAAGKILPKGFSAGPFGREVLVPFLKNTAQWTMILPSRKELRFTANDASLWASLLEGIPFGRSSLSRVLPDSTSYVLDLVTSEGFRKAYTNYKDANVKLGKYNAALSALRKESGVNPLKWESHMGIREVALAEWDSHRVVLLRPSSRMGRGSAAPVPNPSRNYPEALYGKAFHLDDCSFCAYRKGWIIMGSEEDVDAFASCQNTMKESPWSSTDSHVNILLNGKVIQWNKKGIRYEL